MARNELTNQQKHFLWDFADNCVWLILLVEISRSASSFYLFFFHCNTVANCSLFEALRNLRPLVVTRLLLPVSDHPLENLIDLRQEVSRERRSEKSNFTWKFPSQFKRDFRVSLCLANLRWWTTVRASGERRKIYLFIIAERYLKWLREISRCWKLRRRARIA